MKIGQYCQRQRCKNVESEQFWHVKIKSDDQPNISVITVGAAVNINVMRRVTSTEVATTTVINHKNTTLTTKHA